MAATGLWLRSCSCLNCMHEYERSIFIQSRQEEWTNNANSVPISYCTLSPTVLKVSTQSLFILSNTFIIRPKQKQSTTRFYFSLVVWKPFTNECGETQFNTPSFLHPSPSSMPTPTPFPSTFPFLAPSFMHPSVCPSPLFVPTPPHLTLLRFSFPFLPSLILLILSSSYLFLSLSL